MLKECALRGGIIKFLTEHLLVAQHVKYDEVLRVRLPRDVLQMLKQEEVNQLAGYGDMLATNVLPEVGQNLGLSLVANNIVTATAAYLDTSEKRANIQQLKRDNAIMMAKLLWHTERYPKSGADIDDWKKFKNAYHHKERDVPKIAKSNKNALKQFLKQRNEEIYTLEVVPSRHTTLFRRRYLEANVRKLSLFRHPEWNHCVN